MTLERGLVDTSVFIAAESGRPIDGDALPDEVAVSVITIAELRAGVLAAADVATRDQRLRTLHAAERLEPLSIDDDVASAWARLRVDLLAAGQRMAVNDSWIAATAVAHGVPIVTQDADFVTVGNLEVVRV